MTFGGVNNTTSSFWERNHTKVLVLSGAVAAAASTALSVMFTIAPVATIYPPLGCAIVVGVAGAIFIASLIYEIRRYNNNHGGAAAAAAAPAGGLSSEDVNNEEFEDNNDSPSPSTTITISSAADDVRSTQSEEEIFYDALESLEEDSGVDTASESPTSSSRPKTPAIAIAFSDIQNTEQVMEALKGALDTLSDKQLEIYNTVLALYMKHRTWAVDPDADFTQLKTATQEFYDQVKEHLETEPGFFIQMAIESAFVTTNSYLWEEKTGQEILTALQEKARSLLQEENYQEFINILDKLCPRCFMIPNAPISISTISPILGSLYAAQGEAFPGIPFLTPDEQKKIAWLFAQIILERFEFDTLNQWVSIDNNVNNPECEIAQKTKGYPARLISLGIQQNNVVSQKIEEKVSSTSLHPFSAALQKQFEALILPLSIAIQPDSNLHRDFTEIVQNVGLSQIEDIPGTNVAQLAERFKTSAARFLP